MNVLHAIDHARAAWGDESRVLAVVPAGWPRDNDSRRELVRRGATIHRLPLGNERGVNDNARRTA